MEKLIDNKMKIFKNIIVSSDGSCYFLNSGEISLFNKLVVFNKKDDKNFSFNQKKNRVLLTQNNPLITKKNI